MDKYKAWDKVEEIMSEVAEIDFVEKTVILKNDIYDDNVYLQGYIERNFDQVELLQYTGLDDIDGKGIYAGHILKISVDKDKVRNGWQKDIKPVYVEVSFNNFHWSCSNGEGKSLYNYLTISFIIMEIAGNIFENPELLEYEGDE